jgi:hypothetical protein
VNSNSEFDLAEQIARIRHLQEETDKFAAEQRKLAAEHGRVNAEQIKLMSEEYKLFAEGRKLSRETRLAPWMIIVAALGGLGGLITVIQTFWRGIAH